MLTDPVSRGELRTAGWLTGNTIEGLSAAGVTVDTPLITVRDVELRRTQRTLKGRIGKRLPAPWVAALPRHLAEPRAVLLDRQPGVPPTLLYVFDVGAAARRGKFVVRVNFRAKGRVFNSVRSGDLTPAVTLRDPSRYLVLYGEV